jgi:hypothetical protein
VAVASVATLASCADSEVILARELDAGVPPPTAPFTPPDAGDALISRPEVPMCVATECPYPRATCAGTSFSCEVDLLADDQNCGECGHACPMFYAVAMKTTCQNGTCVGACLEARRKDCNGIPDDGCEVDVELDPANCGACGNVCAPGVHCIQGKCGCPQGMLECGGTCIDPASNRDHCGACGNACVLPSGVTPPPDEHHLEYTCVGGACGFGCTRNYDFNWTDCNDDKADGCEVDLNQGTPDRCGACNVACQPDERCVLIEQGTPNKFQCGCKVDETACGEEIGPGVFTGCKNLLTDPENCGACRHRCPAGSQHQKAGCEMGVCRSECEPGWADCNGIAADGCETNLRSDPAHCGGCGVRCDVAAGQPCVDGQCLERACDQDAGETTK